MSNLLRSCAYSFCHCINYTVTKHNADWQIWLSSMVSRPLRESVTRGEQSTLHGNGVIDTDQKRD